MCEVFPRGQMIFPGSRKNHRFRALGEGGEGWGTLTGEGDKDETDTGG